MNTPRIALINPNASRDTTSLMTGVASAAVRGAALVKGFTASSGPMVITDEESLAAASDRVVECGQELQGQGFDAILVSAFGDPGLDRLRRIQNLPATGIAEAGMAEAASGGRRFSIVTTTPLLKRAIVEIADLYGYAGALTSVRLTPGDPKALMADADGLARALLEACRKAVADDGAEAILIGGGPLAKAAAAIASQVGVSVTNPVSAGARLALHRLGVRPE